MTEWKLFDEATPHVSTFAFHEHRDRAPHLEQPDHRQRLEACAHLIRDLKPASVVDLGCGDGGLLSLIRDIPSWGYDFQPANADGWIHRGVTAEQRDVFSTLDVPRWGDAVVMTEVLEHLADPHTVVEWVSRYAKWVIVSSPKDETGDRHGDCHAWAWDLGGYRALFDPHFHIASHTTVDWSQIIVGRSRHT